MSRSSDLLARLISPSLNTAAGMVAVADPMAEAGVDSTEAAEAGLMAEAVAAFTAAVVAARSTVVAEAAHIAVVEAEDTAAA